MLLDRSQQASKEREGDNHEHDPTAGVREMEERTNKMLEAAIALFLAQQRAWRMAVQEALDGLRPQIPRSAREEKLMKAIEDFLKDEDD